MSDSRILRDCTGCFGGSGGRENSTLNDVTRALFTAGAIGRITAENASISGAVGGCQAECGTAAAMAAAAAVDLLHGTTEEMGNAMALAMKNIFGACL